MSGPQPIDTQGVLRPLGMGALAVFAALATSGVLLAVGGYSPVEAFGALFRGSFGSWDRFASFTLVKSTPLLFTGLAVAVAFKAGVWNIGAEGQLHAGALAGVAVVVALAGAPTLVLLPLALLSGAAMGALWAAVPAVMKMKLGVGEVITTLLMNFVALFLTQFLVQGPMREARGVFNQTEAIPEAAQLPLILPGSRLHLGFLIALGTAGLLWVYLNKTAAGFRIRAVGASPRVSQVSGRFEPAPTIWKTFLLSGALAGLAGWIEVGGVTHRLYEGLSPGWGYTAIAVALLARLNPVALVFAAVFFGALDVGGGAMQRDAGVPAVWVRGIEALVILSVLAVDRLLLRSPRSGSA
ncbi:MAG: ABC transporter permease [Longimicrobiales bacterium]